MVDFVRFSAMSVGGVLPAISFKMQLRNGPISEFYVKFHEELIYDVSRHVEWCLEAKNGFVSNIDKYININI